MNRYTETYKEEIESAKRALAVSIPMILTKKASVKIKNKKDHIVTEHDGNMMTQIYMVAMAAAKIINEADDEDMVTLFIAAVEMEIERQKEQV